MWRCVCAALCVDCRETSDAACRAKHLALILSSVVISQKISLTYFLYLKIYITNKFFGCVDLQNNLFYVYYWIDILCNMIHILHTKQNWSLKVSVMWSTRATQFVASVSLPRLASRRVLCRGNTGQVCNNDKCGACVEAEPAPPPLWCAAAIGHTVTCAHVTKCPSHASSPALVPGPAPTLDTRCHKCHLWLLTTVSFIVHQSSVIYFF